MSDSKHSNHRHYDAMSTNSSAQHKILVIVESSLISSEAPREITTLQGCHLSFIRSIGSVTSLSVTLMKNLRESSTATIPQIVLVPGSKDLSTRNLALISADLQYLRQHQKQASQLLADRFIQPLSRMVLHLNLLGSTIWIAYPTTCPAFMRKPFPIPHIIHQANILVQQAITKINSSQKLPNLPATNNLQTTMITVFGKSRKVQRPICTSKSSFLADGKRLTNQARSLIYRRICQEAHEVCQHAQLQTFPQKRSKLSTKCQSHPQVIPQKRSKVHHKQYSRSSKNLNRNKAYTNLRPHYQSRIVVVD